MTFGNSPGPTNSIFLAVLNLLRNVFGQVQWQAPRWIPWIVRQVRGASRYIMASPQRIVVIGTSVGVLGVGLLWYENRPKPHYVEYEITEPAITTYDNNGGNARLSVESSGSGVIHFTRLSSF